MGKIVDLRSSPPPGYRIRGECSSSGAQSWSSYRWSKRYEDGSITVSRPHEKYEDAVAEAWDDHAMEIEFNVNRRHKPQA